MHTATEAIQKEYDRLATGYDQRWRSYVDVTLRAVLDVLDVLHTGGLRGWEHVLDVACGTGELERRLLTRWPDLQLVGADVSLGMLRQASQKAGNASVSWVQSEASSLPFPDQTFDLVLCANSFHYFREPMQSLREVHRVLRPEGCFVLVDWCDDYLSCKLCGLWLRLTDPAFCGTHSLQSGRGFLQKAGFEIVRHDHFRVGWIWGMMRFVCRLPRTPPRLYS